MRVARCKRTGCDAAIVWFETVAGCRQCFDARPHPRGPCVLEAAGATVTGPSGELVASADLGLRRARVLGRDEEAPPGTQRWMPHHATCANPPQARAAYHRCALDGCEQRIPRRYLMCRRHWRLVPPRIRDQVIVSYGGGQPSERYGAICKVALREAELAEAGQRALLDPA